MTLSRKELKEIEDVIIDRAEVIIFGTNRNKPKKNGSKKIQDDSGDLRRSIKGNKNFIKFTDKKIEINVELMEYYLYLDEGTKRIEPWFLTEALFEDKEVRDVIKKVTTSAGRRAVLNMINSIK